MPGKIGERKRSRYVKVSPFEIVSLKEYAERNNAVYETFRLRWKAIFKGRYLISAEEALILLQRRPQPKRKVPQQEIAKSLGTWGKSKGKK